MPRVRILRRRALRGAFVPYRVDVALETVTSRLWMGRAVDLELSPGVHPLTVWSGGRRIGGGRVGASSLSDAIYVLGPDHPITRVRCTRQLFRVSLSRVPD